MNNKLYLIGNSHIDPVWLWRWHEGVTEIIATYRSALDRMKDFDDFKFTSACAMYYELIEKMDPEMFEEIKERVREGRWNIVGGWFLQPDCNIPDGESFARHTLISQRYFREKFGITAVTGYNVDSFGHNANLPKILRAGGMENYVFMRPNADEQGRDETLFEWKSSDGSSVTAYRIPTVYNNDSTSMRHIDAICKKIDEENLSLMAFYGVGNHGGGPTIKLIEELKEYPRDDKLLSTPDEYFESIDKTNLPVIEDELQHHARGCYSACSFVKASNRKCEQNLIAAEKICSMAAELTDYVYPEKKLTKAWKNLLFNQFHDITAGCSIRKAYEDAGHLFGEVMSITEQEMCYAMKKIGMNIDTLGDEALPAYKIAENWKIWQHEVLGTPIVVFNPHAHPVRECIAVNALATTMLTDCDGNEIAFQYVRGDQTNSWNDKNHTAFIAEVPAMGYRVYRLFVEKKSEREFPNEFHVTETSLENSVIKVDFDRQTGDICKIYDKTNDTYILDGRCSAILLDESGCDTWAHAKDELGEYAGSFTKASFQMLEGGPIRAGIRVTIKTPELNKSAITREFYLTSGDKRVFVRTVVDFREHHRTLKFTFPAADEVTAKIPYGTITRKGCTGEEPCGSWIASGSLGIANDSKYAYDVKDGMLRMTVLRSTIYADHFGERDDRCEFMEQGEHEFFYTIFPYTTSGKAEEIAQNLNFPPRYMKEVFHKGKLPEEMSCFQKDCDNLIVSAVKKSDDSDERIVRVYEIDGKSAKTKVKLFGKEIDINLKPYELKTYTEDGKEVNLMEW